MKINLSFLTTLQNETKVELDRMFPQEQDAVRELLNQIIIEGQTYPQNQPLSKVEFADYRMSHDAFVVTYNHTKSTNADENLGIFLSQTQLSRMVQPHLQCWIYCTTCLSGVKAWVRLMGAMLEIAPIKGYTAVMFNFVFATNTPSIRLWQSLGFETIGRIPSPGHLSDGRGSRRPFGCTAL
ncbi:GNAT family N-acetyltransferase [Coleofasciculus sp. H7-2]|uniref:GNAT family N-acetyltransferase n=1 Tax=Coleofasciculus sp. H7-2 TaxID=3351545 RepID=UPI0036732C46